MKKYFTPCIAEKELDKEKKMTESLFDPREETLVLIRQFARVYRVESKLEQNVCSFILN